MKTWWKQRKAKTRKSRKQSEHYTFWDFFIDTLMWIPELIVLPFRIIFWLVRGAGKIIGDIFDVF